MHGCEIIAGLASDVAGRVGLWLFDELFWCGSRLTAEILVNTMPDGGFASYIAKRPSGLWHTTHFMIGHLRIIVFVKVHQTQLYFSKYAHHQGLNRSKKLWK